MPRLDKKHGKAKTRAQGLGQEAAIDAFPATSKSVNDQSDSVSIDNDTFQRFLAGAVHSQVLGLRLQGRVLQNEPCVGLK
jgi:hypothetical protein